MDRRALLTEELDQRAAQRRVTFGRAIVERGRPIGGQLAEQSAEDRARDRLTGRAAHRHPHDVVTLALQQARAGVDHRPGDPVHARRIEAGEAECRHVTQSPPGIAQRRVTEWCNIAAPYAPQCWERIRRSRMLRSRMKRSSWRSRLRPVSASILRRRYMSEWRLRNIARAAELVLPFSRRNVSSVSTRPRAVSSS